MRQMVLLHLLYQEQLVDFQVHQLQQSIIRLAELDLNQFLQSSILHQEIKLHKTGRLLHNIIRDMNAIIIQIHKKIKVIGEDMQRV